MMSAKFVERFIIPVMNWTLKIVMGFNERFIFPVMEWSLDLISNEKREKE